MDYGGLRPLNSRPGMYMAVHRSLKSRGRRLIFARSAVTYGTVPVQLQLPILALYKCNAFFDLLLCH